MKIVAAILVRIPNVHFEFANRARAHFLSITLQTSFYFPRQGFQKKIVLAACTKQENSSI